MADFNKVILLGNLTRDPEVRYTPSGTAVTDLRMAMNRRFRGSDGQDRDETCFVSVTVWGRQAENCGQYLRKGRQALVEGRLKLDEWEKEGQKISRLTVTAERVQFVGGSPRSGEFDDGPAPRQAPQAQPAREAPPASEEPEEPPPDEDVVEDEDNLPF